MMSFDHASSIPRWEDNVAQERLRLSSRILHLTPISNQLSNLPNSNSLPLIPERKPSKLRIILKPLYTNNSRTANNFQSRDNTHPLLRETRWFLRLPVRLGFELVQ